jgi:hypothetical protein
MRVLIAFIVLTAFLTAAIVYTYYIRRGVIMYEGFSEQDITAIESTVRQAVPQLDQATIARVLKLIERLAGTILNPSFFTDAIRRSTMSPVELAREYMNSQKAKS